MTLLDFARIQQPEIMTEFDKAPWNFKIFSPMRFEDAAVITIYLYIGKKKAVKAYRIDLNLFPSGTSQRVKITK